MTDTDRIIADAIKAKRVLVDGNGAVWRVGIPEQRKAHGIGSIRSVEPRRCDYIGKIGYRFFGIDGRNVLAHRAVWIALRGPIPDGHEINHKNGDRSDNHPDNLEVVTPADNKRHAREVLHAPVPYGSRASKSKLTDEQVMEIRRRLAAGERTRDLAAEFGVGSTAISCVGLGRTHRHTLSTPPGDATPAQEWRGIVGIAPSVDASSDFHLPTRREASAMGLCWMCRSRLPVDGFKTCADCLVRRNATWRSSMAPTPSTRSGS